jgi:hypothetical protein
VASARRLVAGTGLQSSGTVLTAATSKFEIDPRGRLVDTRLRARVKGDSVTVTATVEAHYSHLGAEAEVKTPDPSSCPTGHAGRLTDASQLTQLFTPPG